MEYIRLGRTDIEVSRICMGCWAIVDPDTWGPQDEKDAVAAIEASLDEGVDFFDTAESYGNGASEELLGRVLEPYRNEVVLATKLRSSCMRRDEAIRECEQSLRRLRTDCIDLFQIHWPDHDLPFEETADALATLVDQGKIRAGGVSNFGPKDLAEFLDVARTEVDQIAYNLLFRAPEHELLALCAEHDVSVLCYSAIAEGLLTGKFETADDVPAGRARTRHFSGQREQARHGAPGAENEVFEAIDRVRQIARRAGLPMVQLAIAWLLRQEAVACAIVGARNEQQARENARSADIDLPDDTLEELARATEPVKEALGPNLDMWQADSRIR
ncbi:MAG: aldo/keto reductase [Planctomycetota bacterium]